MRCLLAAVLPCLLLTGCVTVAPQSGADAARPDPVAHLPPLPAVARPGGESAAWWFHAGALTAARAHGAARPKARNLILFVGDGMSIPTLAAARALGGQRQGDSGEEFRLSFEDFPHTALARTYNTDAQTPDSAGTATAMSSGAKTRMGFIGIGQAARRADCASSRGQELLSLIELAEIAGLATGVVTTTRVTHATPASMYAHAPERRWESDHDLPAAARDAGCSDIARQLIEFPFGDGLDVALGGGRAQFLPQGNDQGTRGLRRDGRDLIAEWQQRPGARYVGTADALAKVDAGHTRHLLGLFSHDHLQYDYERRKDARGEPSLAEMTHAAIRLLRERPHGFVLLIEGGRIDHAHHAGNAFRALDDTLALSDAVRVAAELTSEQDTLILVTADHAHTLQIAGYPRRGNPILGLVRGPETEGMENAEPTRDALGQAYPTLSYSNGPGYAGATPEQPGAHKRYPHVFTRSEAGVMPDFNTVDTLDPDFLQPALYPLGSETHGGDDVAVFARGPGAEAVRGSLEQNALFHLMLQAQPVLRQRLCALGSCESADVPTRLPDYQALRQQLTAPQPSAKAGIGKGRDR